MADFETIGIASDTTDEGETAPDISAIRENGTFYLHQYHPHDDPRKAQIATVGMSREQARRVRDALNRLLEPTWDAAGNAGGRETP
jgi:hypothetical protein